MQTVAESGVLGQILGHRQIKLLVRGIVAVIVVAGLMLFLDWSLRSGTMPIEEITFKGRFKNISHAQLENVIAKHLKNNFLMVNLEVIQKDIETLPWVYRASVRRKWPTGLYVEFMEQVPVARWGKTAWLNNRGDIVNLENNRHGETGLPTVIGPEKDSAQLLQTFISYQKQFLSVGLSLSKLAVSERNSFRLSTVSGVDIILGKRDVNSRLARFLKVFPETLANHQGAFSRVDLRYTNGFAVLWNETASIDLKQSVFWGANDKT